jgi:hypothetical protein
MAAHVLVLVAALAAMMPTSGCSFDVRGSDHGTGGVGITGDDPLESPGSTVTPLPEPPDLAAPADLASSPPDLAKGAPPDLAKAPPPPPPQPGVGSACTDNKSCGGNGLICVQHVGGLGIFGADFPGGYCSVTCNNDNQCPAGSICQSIKGVSICLVSCPPASCRGSYTCCKDSGDNTCTPSNVCGD